MWVLKSLSFKETAEKAISKICEASEKKQSACCSILHQPKRPEILKKRKWGEMDMMKYSLVKKGAALAVAAAVTLSAGNMALAVI